MKYEIVDIKKIKLDPENPRIADKLGNRKFDSIEEQNSLIASYLRGDTGNTEAGPSCSELEKSIHSSKGIIEPIILLSEGDGQYLCIEGNTRLSIYLSFSNDQYPDEKEWKKIPSLVHDELTVSQIDELRLQAHFVGKKEWTPYAKGRYITQLVKSGTSLDDIKKIVGGSDSKTRANFYAYKIFKEKYETKFNPKKDNIFPDKTKFSMFTTVPEGGKIAMALELRGETMDDYAQWVKEDKLGSANDVRRYLEKVLLNEEVYNEFKKKKNSLPDVIPLLPSDSNINKITLKDASITQICDVLNDRLLGHRKANSLSSVKEQEGPGVIDSLGLLQIEIESSLEVLDK